MFRLQEYQPHAARVADLLPWAGLLGPGTLLTKTGELVAVLQVRGPDLESASQSEQVALTARLNNALKRFPGGWTVQTEAWRRTATGYPESVWHHPVAALLDAERRADFVEAGRHFETDYFVTLSYRTPSEQRTRLAQWLWEHLPEEAVHYGQVRQYFEETVVTWTRLVQDLFPWVVPLEGAALLRYLHGTATLHHAPVHVPEVPMYLDVLLGTEDLAPGIRPRLGTQWLRTLTVRSLPATTWPGLFASLESLGFPYRWCQRWIVLDRAQALRECRKYERRWLSKRKGLLTLLREEILKTTSALSDPDAEDKAADARAAQGLLASGAVALGYYTGTVVVWDTDTVQASEKLSEVVHVLQRVGATVHVEDLNAVEAWLGTIPGNVYANLRRPLLHSLNLAHLLPCHAVWAGPERCVHLDGPPLLYTSSTERTPFRLSLHQGDVGDTLIIGPKGSGKSTLLSLLALQWQRYPDAQTFFFDQGRSAQVATRAMGGQWYALGTTEGVTLQPLVSIDHPDERAWAMEWLEVLLLQERVALTPPLKTALWDALANLAASAPRYRTLTSLTGLVQDATLREALRPYTLAGVHGGLLDGDQDRLSDGCWQCFETSALLDLPSAVVPTLFVLFHRLEQALTGAPTLILLDEAWLYLDHPAFAQRLRLWLKTLRKQNASVIFANQHLADVSESSLAATVAQECHTRIFLPNARALESQIAAYYASFGLSPRQMEIIALGSPKRHYYYQSPAGNRLFELELGPVALALAGAGSPADLALLEQLTAAGKQNWAVRWLDAKGLPWASAVLHTHVEEVSVC